MNDDLHRHERLLRALAYRMLGSVQDAEEVVQETFVRALEKPPARDRPVRPWLVRVAMNLCRDRLRRRKAAPWRGPWLPEPALLEHVDPHLGPDSQVEAGRMASYAWMVALEVLTPSQRAVVVLREVLEHDVRTTAQMLEMSPAAVRAAHARARKALVRPVDGGADVQQGAFERLLGAFYAGDVEAIAATMVPDVCLQSDANGRYHAAGRPVVGAMRVAKFLLNIVRMSGGGASIRLVPVVGGLALVVELAEPQPKKAPVSAVLLELDGDGQIVGLFNVLLPEKLTALGVGG